MSNIFGANPQSNPQNTTGSGLFGSNASANQPAAGGLFGSSTNQAGGGGLFGSTTNTGGGLFGNNTTQNSGGGGLFGASNAQTSGSTGGLFGGTAAQPAPSGGLFGNQNATNTANNASSVFGNATTNTGMQNTSSIFGPTAAPRAPNTSLFSNNPQPQGSLFGATTAQPPSQQQQAVPFSRVPMASVGQAGYPVPQAQLQSLHASGFSTVPYEKPVIDQIRTVYGKWNVDEETSLLRTYFYNAVNKSLAPFYHPSAVNGETEIGWEEALNQKPEIPKIPGVDQSELSYIPTLCRGFKGLGERIHYQVNTVKEMQSRLHEMNNSLNAVMNKHQQDLTVRIASTKKQHQVLSQRCLRLAAKVQVLRNRGYVLDGAEENLRKTLLSLQSQVSDPGFAGREDEIWARMVALRERVRWLEEEGKKAAVQLDAQAESGRVGEGVPEEVLVKTRKILKDYDDQLRHLSKELADVKKEYGDYETAQRR